MARSSLIATALALAAVGSVHAQTKLDPNYYTPESFGGTCVSGKKQSPVALVSASTKALPAELVSNIAMPIAQGVVAKNAGNVAQVEWASLVNPDSLPSLPAGGDGISAVLSGDVPVTKTVKVEPIQFHFHAPSEHSVDGCLGGAEVHIVSAVAEGEAPEWGCDEVWKGGDPNLAQCIAVFGIVYKLGDSSPEYFDKVFDTAPTTYDEKNNDNNSVPYPDNTFDLTTLLPEDLSYFTYEGSLTTPDCNEGLRWTVFKEPKYITPETMQKMYDWVQSGSTADGKNNGYRANNRVPQPLNGRTVWEHDVVGNDMGDMGENMGGGGGYGGSCPPCPSC